MSLGRGGGSGRAKTVRGLGLGWGRSRRGRRREGGRSGFGGEVEDIVVVVVGSRNPLKLHIDGDEKPPATNITKQTKEKLHNKIKRI